MNEPKPFASLSPTLLARKGAARPAMRTQLQPLGHYPAPEPTGAPGLAHHPQDDLGWNDMGGEEHPAPHQSLGEPSPAEDASPNVVAFATPEVALEAPLTTGVPEVVRQRDALAGTMGDAGTPAADAPPALIPIARHRWTRLEPPATSAARRSALADGRRAAFTLRVDGERHLKLRLACTVQGRSAQQLVTEALDRLFDQLPELDDLARRVRRR